MSAFVFFISVQMRHSIQTTFISNLTMKKKVNILVIEHGVELIRQLNRICSQKKFTIMASRTIEAGFERFEDHAIDIMILTGSVARLGRIRGMEFLDIISEKSAATQILFLASSKDMSLVFSALKRGSYQYAKLPIADGELEMLIQAALLHQPQYTPNLLLKSEARKTTFEKMVGGSAKMIELYRQIRQAANTNMPVLLTGETGTGKDLVARAIHQQSKRSSKAFLPIHLGALPPELVAGELFGYEKGAFTGATQSHRGMFEKAEGGTIFLDEIGTIDEKVQISLLRLLETRKLERIGGTRTISANVRIVTATNENLSEAVEQGRFREDLFFRLDIFQIALPPLRERGGDIALLVNSFLKQFSDDYQRDIVGISPECISVFEAYDWPGNVREIKNVVHRAVLNCTGGILLPEHLPERLQESRKQPQKISLPVGCTLKEAEREIILRTLNWTGNNRQRTASILGISRRSLYNKLTRYEL
ncbi:acetoacetate metabolism regulatory protein AtoC [Desulfosarcina ovata subsp. sediminis]|uniref:Acetoacetate metabolism regulatory protein AtoC n=2 Tax=Desulfosarcina ovata TaxID=83564 RepID=A0A5K7ZSW9_9BACT|nr:acetoacetate metabolism regulatory protein AtoC [Desulfosarcina ovata subsp. sediminis]